MRTVNKSGLYKGLLLCGCAGVLSAANPAYAQQATTGAPGDPPGQMREGFLDLVDQHQAQVARLQAGEGRVDGDELAADLVDVLRARRALQALVDEITGAPHRTGRSLVPIRLVVRESTAAPRR